MTDAQLITTIIAAYALTKDDVSALATQITKSRLNVAQASYRRAQRTTGLSPNYVARNSLQRQIERQSAKDAQSIADTHKSLLRSFLETAVKVYVVAQIVSMVSDWLGDFLGWKSKQIAHVTCSSGQDLGTRSFIEDLLEADKGSGTLEDDNGNIIIDTSKVDISRYEIVIEPDTASNDVCLEVAGKSYSLSDYMDLYSLVGSFPVHVGCIHNAVIYQV